MNFWGKIENLSRKKINIFLILFFLVFLQLAYSLLFPSYDQSSSYWKTIAELSSYRGYPLQSFDNSIAGKIYPLISNYHINGDSAAQILLAHDFPRQYFEGNLTFIDRPLYAFLVHSIAFPLRQFVPSYALTFAVGLFLDFTLFLSAAFLFYLMVEKLTSFKVALLSSILLIFSPFAHIWLVQPGTDIFGAFVAILSLYLFYNYISRPSLRKLIVFSLAIGILMLGKMLFAIPLFIALSALFFKRYLEGILFLAIHALPLIFWYLLATKILGLGFYSPDNTTFKMYIIEGWLFNFLQYPWQATFRIFLSALPSFIVSITYGFLLIPAIFAVFGFKKLVTTNTKFFVSAYIFSFFSLYFAMNYYSPRHAFLLFPAVYPLAVLGMDFVAEFLRKYKKWLPAVFYPSVLAFLIFLSSVNVFEIFNYGAGLTGGFN